MATGTFGTVSRSIKLHAHAVGNFWGDAPFAAIPATLVVQVRTHSACGLLTLVLFPQTRDCPPVAPIQLCNSAVIALSQNPAVAAFEKLGDHSASLCIVEIVSLWCLGNTLSARHAPSHYRRHRCATLKAASSVYCCLGAAVRDRTIDF